MRGSAFQILAVIRRLNSVNPSVDSDLDENPRLTAAGFGNDVIRWDTSVSGEAMDPGSRAIQTFCDVIRTDLAVRATFEVIPFEPVINDRTL
jgi:hypothetical protein